MKSFLKICLVAAVLSAASVSAMAQPNVLPKVTQINPGDLFLDIPNGFSGPTSVWAPAPALTAQYGYVKAVPLTGFTYTFTNFQSYLALNPAGTLATGTVTLAPAPSDGAKECIFSTQTVTALTLNANTGQSINNAVTTLAANTSACYLYSASNLTWDRT